MRLRLFPTVGLACVASLLGAAGCDSTSSGHLTDNPAPPALVKIMVQDEQPAGGRNVATDLLDTGPLLTCDDTHPCPCYIGVICTTSAGVPTCDNGMCPDPIHEGPVELGYPIEAGGLSVRLVFSKVLDGTKMAPKAPIYDATSGYSTDLAPGIVQLLDPSGAAIDSYASYDASGSPTTASDVQLEPFGPALVLKPKTALAPNTTYTVKLNPTLVVDKQGQNPTNNAASPVALPNPFTATFTTEALAVTLGSDPSALPAPGTTATTPLTATVAPNDVIQMVFNDTVDPTTLGGVTLTGPTGSAVPVLVFLDVGSDKTMCVANKSTRIVDVVAVSATGSMTPKDLPTGKYTLKATGVKFLGTGSPAFPDLTAAITVMGPDGVPELDPSAVHNHVLPSQCMTAADGGTP